MNTKLLKLIEEQCHNEDTNERVLTIEVEQKEREP